MEAHISPATGSNLVFTKQLRDIHKKTSIKIFPWLSTFSNECKGFRDYMFFETTAGEKVCHLDQITGKNMAKLKDDCNRKHVLKNKKKRKEIDYP